MSFEVAGVSLPMSIIPNAPILIIVAVFVLSGAYLILRPERYKGELWKTGDDVISRFPPWAVRILGGVIIVAALGLSYLFLAHAR